MKGIMWINLLLGVWLVVAALAMGVHTGLAANNVVLGILFIACSWWMLAAMAPPVGIAWFEILCGLWLIAAPFALGFSAMHGEVVNNVISGIIGIIVAAFGAAAIARTPTAA